MASSGINFKVYTEIGDNTEVKRFFIDSGVVTSYLFMKEKIKSVFPELKDMDSFKISWKDADGDYISITNDEDIITAITEMNDNPKVLYVHAEMKNAHEDNARAFWVICDVCQKAIIGYRYKCIECPDYDLCSTCESSGNHSEHMVLRLPSSSTPIAKIDRKMMYNAAKALKKSAYNVAKQAHKCARESFKAGEKEKHIHEGAEVPTLGQNNAYECPFSSTDMSSVFAQNITPFIEVLSKGASNLTKEPQTTSQNPLSDIVRSMAEAFTEFVNPEAASKPSQNPSTKSSQTSPTLNQKPESSAPTAPSAEHGPNLNSQEMDWTLVNDSEESTSPGNASSQTPIPQAPPPPQDVRLMKGLAQLHEMGFSNENQFLNYMLEAHNYNVGDVIKAILEMK